MSKYLKIGGLLLVGTLVGLLIRSGAPEVDLAGVYSLSNQSFTQGLKVGTTDQFQVSSAGAVTTSDDITVGDDLTVSGGALTVTTGASATSTATVGCVTTYATSSATAIKLKFGSANATGTVDGQTGVGLVVWKYGTCP